MKDFLSLFFGKWWLPVCFGIVTMLLPFISISYKLYGNFLLISTCLLGLGVYVMACSVYKLSGTGRGMKIFTTCFVLITALIELGLFALLISIFGAN